MSGVPRLVGSLLYGAGLRLQEALELRVKDVDFGRGQLVVRQGKGRKDRVTMLPDMAKHLLEEHLHVVRRQHERDLAAGFGRVGLPEALSRKYPNAGTEWVWQFVFQPLGSAATFATVPRLATTCMNLSFSARSPRPFERRASPNERAATPFVTRLRHISWKMGTTFAPCRSFLGMRTSAPR